MVRVLRGIGHAIAALDESWNVWPSMPERVVEVVSRVLGGCSVLLHHWADEKLWLDAHNLPRDPSRTPWVTEGIGRRLRLYDPERLGTDADRVVTGDELRHRYPHAWQTFHASCMRDCEMGDQIRALVTDDDGKFLAFFGAYTPPERRVVPEMVETFTSLLPAVSERLRTWKLFAEHSRDRAALLELIGELSKPAFVVSAKGIVLHANVPARLTYEATPEWLPEACLSDTPPAWLRKIPLDEGNRRLWICLPSERSTDVHRLGLWASRAWDLPPRLLSIAAKLVAGYSDKEIAQQTGLSFATVRTYVQQASA